MILIFSNQLLIPNYVHTSIYVSHIECGKAQSSKSRPIHSIYILRLFNWQIIQTVLHILVSKCHSCDVQTVYMLKYIKGRIFVSLRTLDQDLLFTWKRIKGNNSFMLFTYLWWYWCILINYFPCSFRVCVHYLTYVLLKEIYILLVRWHHGCTYEEAEVMCMETESAF